MADKKVIFASKHANLSIMREPQQVTRSVNGIMQVIMEDRPPFKFVNHQLTITDPAELKEIRKARHYGTLFEEIPASVVAEAEKKTEEDIKAEVQSGKFIPDDAVDDIISEQEEPQAETETEPEPQVDEVDASLQSVPEVTSYNEAQDYLRDNHGLEFKDVNTKEKVRKQADRLGVDFPNYDLE